MFQIDITLRQKCKLEATKSNAKIVEVRIKKTKVGQSSWKYELNEVDLTAYLTCKPGYYDLRIKEPELNCGIAQILIQLCLNEENIHDVKNIENQARFSIGPARFIWVKNHCKKFLFTGTKENLGLLGFVGISELASSILQAAILSQYNGGLIKLPNLDFYPPEGFTFTTDLLGRYDGKGRMVKDGKVVNIDKPEWFFCLQNWN